MDSRSHGNRWGDHQSHKGERGLRQVLGEQWSQTGRTSDWDFSGNQ